MQISYFSDAAADEITEEDGETETGEARGKRETETGNWDARAPKFEQRANGAS